jgi:hypothetical protein
MPLAAGTQTAKSSTVFRCLFDYQNCFSESKINSPSATAVGRVGELVTCPWGRRR